jgi:hypothetical protein
MWESFEARLDENERDRPLPLRRALFDVLRGSGLRPGGGVTKKCMTCPARARVLVVLTAAVRLNVSGLSRASCCCSQAMMRSARIVPT